MFCVQYLVFSYSLPSLVLLVKPVLPLGCIFVQPLNCRLLAFKCLHLARHHLSTQQTHDSIRRKDHSQEYSHPQIILTFGGTSLEVGTCLLEHLD